MKIWIKKSLERKLVEIDLEYVKVGNDLLWYSRSITESFPLCSIASSGEGIFIKTVLRNEDYKITTIDDLKARYIWHLEDRIKELEKAKKSRWRIFKNLKKRGRSAAKISG